MDGNNPFDQQPGPSRHGPRRPRNPGQLFVSSSRSNPQRRNAARGGQTNQIRHENADNVHSFYQTQQLDSVAAVLNEIQYSANNAQTNRMRQRNANRHVFHQTQQPNSVAAVLNEIQHSANNAQTNRMRQRNANRHVFHQTQQPNSVAAGLNEIQYSANNAQTNRMRQRNDNRHVFHQTQQPNSTSAIDNIQVFQRQTENFTNNANKNQECFKGNRNRSSDTTQYNENLRNHDGKKNIKKTERNIGFKTLEELTNLEPKELLEKFFEKKDSFIKLLNSPIEKMDMFVLIVKLMAKLCGTSFEQLKSQILLQICNSEFIKNLRNYLMDLPYQQGKMNNSLYWNNPNNFWENFLTFCECIINISPSVAFYKCRTLIEASTKCCLDGLSDRHSYKLPEEYELKLAQLRDRLAAYEKEDVLAAPKKKMRRDFEQNEEPPENFRELSIVPLKRDLYETQPFLRPNIVNGSYSDIEHYLDVQFRLIREDCFGPLREGLQQYLQAPNKKKYDSIRIYRNVKLIGPYASKTKVGSLIQLDENAMKRFKKINWAHSKRFIYGSLLLLTKDNFASFVTATIIDRDIKYLEQGKIPITTNIGELSGEIEDNSVNNSQLYIMVESEVYYEPYFHIMKTLKDPNFPHHLAMDKYIVKVDPVPMYPSYLNQDTEFSVETLHNVSTFQILNETSWPSECELGLDRSQYEAYKLALTHEFSVIQGPPGTGKTYLGVKVAKTLLKNVNTPGCKILVVCYTNHALDQFLEAMLQVTDSIIRIGGQSKNEAMVKININNLRLSNKANRMFNEQRYNLKIALNDMEKHNKILESIYNGIISYNNIKAHFPEIQFFLEKYMSSTEDPLRKWLFAKMERLQYDFENETFDDQSIDASSNIIDQDIYDRNEVILDNFDDRDEVYSDDPMDIKTSFNLNSAEADLRRLVQCYLASQIEEQRQHMYLDICRLKSEIELFKKMCVYQTRKPGIDLTNIISTDPTTVPNIERWTLYFSWAEVIINILRQQIKPLQQSLDEANLAYEEARMAMDINIIQHKKIVGMTTSGAARLHKLIRALEPPIVIVEEAAEVLEAHIVTSLHAKCQHLILIGDHQQLRPSAADMRLAKHYNIEVSLFERMIMNKVHSVRLSVQHRMRPEIAALISPHIYPDLDNHPAVGNFPRVRGITKNVFFLTHTYKEEEVDESTTKCNRKEGDLVLRLANYIVQQGYKPGDVTILSPYAGQMFYMRKERQKYAHLSQVKITVVDNYQGEESKIILLSLVRNNKENKIGFLGTKNRICVALSRAKEGFYIFGNIEMLKMNSTLWNDIAATLESNGSLGKSLNLKCETHEEQITSISNPDDFDKVPEGGCLLKCNYHLPCGHPCPRICHGYDQGHAKIICPMKCERIICDLNHICPLKCCVKCKPCMVNIKKTLPCNHSKGLPCHVEPSDPLVKCMVKVTVKLPDCGHEVEKHCHVDTKSIKCPVRCVYRVEECGHECLLTCHVNHDPDHENYKCEKPCAREKRGCTANLLGDRGEHQCRNKCYQQCEECTVEVIKKRSTCKHAARVACNKNIDDIECRKNCARVLPCKHFCKKKCYEKCGDCKQRVKKVIPSCQHEIEIECQQEATRDLCKRECERTLPCGHKCTQTCGEICDPMKCDVIIPRPFNSPCGHSVNLPCKVFNTLIEGKVTSDTYLEFCTEPCNVQLECGHLCGGSCSRCRQGRLHAPCTQTCHQMNICGHECEEPCNQNCPPCPKRCELKCPHSECKKLCGAPCVPCREKCDRRCVHGACSRRCSEPCDRPPCNHACPRALPCGHRCRGLCGELCPNICNICQPEQFPKDFLGDDFDDDAKFVQLQDCPHVLEVEDMDTMMYGDSDTVKIRTCPFCRKPVINTYRYKDLVNKMYKTEINPIKLKVFGTHQDILKKNQDLHNRLEEVFDRNQVILLYAEKGRNKWSQAFQVLNRVIRKQKKVSLVTLEMQFIYLNILDMLGDCFNKFMKVKSDELKVEFMKPLNMICETLESNVHKISQQQQKDINNEIRRMDSIIQLSKILSHSSYLSIKNSPAAIKATEISKKAILSWKIFNEEDSVTTLTELQKVIKVSGIVTKEERDLIVKAIGLKAGHWYKCPNGHFYCIGECGGAMQVSRCVECGAKIGGGSHTLLPDNAHAPEMDGSRFAAWSNEYNNMANFRFD